MFTQLMQYNDIGLFILRAAIAIIFFSHALPKLKNKMGGTFLLLGVVESASSIALVLGLYTQLAALLLAIVMVGAIWMKITKWGVPFMAMDKTGWEFDFILFAANIAILLGGGGSVGIQ
ncbi:MAG: DoxX family protein [Candidatus Colwellbacteria bacterium]|nr:DoxX family protein [Candidatus Colwellbacteria bacterium]